MKLVKMFGLTAVAAIVAMAFVGATSASASSTQLCISHNIDTGLECGPSRATSVVHQVLKAGTVGKLLAAISVLCLGFLVEATPLLLVKDGPQEVHSLKEEFTGCGTGSTHNNCTVTVPTKPLFKLLKTGLDAGTLTGVSGQTRLVCSNLGLDCLYDVEGMEFSVGAGHLTAEETAVNELGGKFFCPDEGLLDALLETLAKTYVLG